MCLSLGRMQNAMPLSLSLLWFAQNVADDQLVIFLFCRLWIVIISRLPAPVMSVSASPLSWRNIIMSPPSPSSPRPYKSSLISDSRWVYRALPSRLPTRPLRHPRWRRRLRQRRFRRHCCPYQLWPRQKLFRYPLHRRCNRPRAKRQP